MSLENWFGIREAVKADLKSVGTLVAKDLITDVDVGKYGDLMPYVLSGLDKSAYAQLPDVVMDGRLDRSRIDRAVSILEAEKEETRWPVEVIGKEKTMVEAFMLRHLPDIVTMGVEHNGQTIQRVRRLHSALSALTSYDAGILVFTDRDLLFLDQGREFRIKPPFHSNRAIRVLDRAMPDLTAHELFGAAFLNHMWDDKAEFIDILDTPFIRTMIKANWESTRMYSLWKHTTKDLQAVLEMLDSRHRQRCLELPYNEALTIYGTE
jgi:hypothetical protein